MPESATPRLRAALADIPLYRAGQRPAAREDLIPYKISSNENPYPPLPRVVDVIAQAAAEVNRYPDPASVQLIAAISQHAGVPIGHVAVGTGAVALCYQVAHATCEPGDEIVYPWRSFEAYPIVTRVAGAAAVPVGLSGDHRHDLSAMADAVTDRTRLIFVCSPNNPTGTVVSSEELVRFLDAVPSDILVVLDEAYVEFSRDPAAANGLSIYRERPNVAVFRTFSKAYGLAGLRVGYAIAHEPVIAALQKTSLPFGVSIVAQAAAVASLADDAELAERVEQLVARRTEVTERLRASGWSLPDSQANFIWLPTGELTDEFTRVCDQAGLTIRAFSGEGVRVTIAEPEANERFVQVAAEFRSGTGSALD